MSDDPRKQFPKPVRYRVLVTSFINNEVIFVPADEPGQPAPPVYVEYDGYPGSNLEPTCDEGRRRKQLGIEQRGVSEDERKRRRTMLTQGEGDLFNELSIPPGGRQLVIMPATTRAAPAVVPIPEDWDKLQAVPLGLLAYKISGEEPATAAEATRIIKAEIARRLSGNAQQAA